MSNLAYIARSLLKRGPFFPFLYAREALAFDLLHGTDTHLRVPKADGPDGQAERTDGVLYVASWTSVVRRALALSEILLGEERFRRSKFLDLGCGKGKALLVYALAYGRSAREVAIGIEYEPTLCETARKNALKLGGLAARMAVHCDSALNIELYLKSELSIIYLYNPFQGETLRSVLMALASHPHLLIYVDPVGKGILPEYGYDIQNFHQGRYNADTWLIATNRISIQAKLS